MDDFDDFVAQFEHDLREFLECIRAIGDLADLEYSREKIEAMFATIRTALVEVTSDPRMPGWVGKEINDLVGKEIDHAYSLFTDELDAKDRT